MGIDCRRIIKSVRQIRGFGVIPKSQYEMISEKSQNEITDVNEVNRRFASLSAMRSWWLISLETMSRDFSS